MRKLIAILIATAALQASAQEKTPLESNLQYAGYLVENSRGVLAYTTLNDIIKDSPRCAQAYYLRAKAYMNDQNTKAAMQDIDMALRIDGQNAEYMWLKCSLLMLRNKPEAAAAYAEKLASAPYNIQNESDERKLLAAEIMVLSGNTIDALPIINSVQKNGAGLHRVRGMAYTKAGLYKEAINNLGMAIDIDPSLGDCNSWRGLAKYMTGQKSDARADWQPALQKGNYAARQYLDKYK